MTQLRFHGHWPILRSGATRGLLVLQTAEDSAWGCGLLGVWGWGWVFLWFGVGFLFGLKVDLLVLLVCLEFRLGHLGFPLVWLEFGLVGLEFFRNSAKSSFLGEYVNFERCCNQASSSVPLFADLFV